MKFTSEDLMKAMGLSVGDRVKFTDVDWDNHIYEIIIQNSEYLVKPDMSPLFPIIKLLNRDFEILPRPKRVGDLKCEECNCKDCPLQYICPMTYTANYKLFEVLEECNVYDKEIYDLLKARLDKEVE